MFCQGIVYFTINLLIEYKFFNILDSIKQFDLLFKKKSINYRENIYSNLLTTKVFINDKKNELKNLNNFT